MYLSLQASKDYLLLMARISLFFGSFHALFLFLFVYILWKHKISKHFLVCLLVTTTLVAGFALSPFVFSHLEFNSANELAPKAAFGIIVFALFTGFCVFGASYVLIKQYLSSRGLEKTHWGYLAIGMTLTYSLVMFFDVLYYNTTGNLNVIRLNHLYVLPFLLSASYVLLRHHFLHIKVLAAELFAFLIIGVSIVQLTFVRTVTELLFSATLFILLVIFSMLLIRSMNKEVQHRAQEAAYEELQKLDEAKSEFITIASHQLRTPLSGLKGYISMAQEGSYGKPPAKMQKTLGNMAQATERLISLADSFLNVSRMRSGKIELNRQETDMKTFVGAIVEEMRPAAEKKGLNLMWKMPTENLPHVSIDQDKIRTVLSGVLDNAIRYTEKGSITIQIKEQKTRLRLGEGGQSREVLISVADTGKGLTKEEIKDIFTSFKRGKTAQALWTEGVGLSLYIAKQLVEAHGDRIWAESKGPGRGSTFYINLPLV
ncbi:MAG: hypothetical protein HYT49_02170 [Candidatus Wildermuthbacteria bacterium]|nr:hypothetical protein [Candidatus Wildermuthbacteria bacterium]